MHKHLKISLWVFFILIVAVSAGWIFTAMRAWEEIISRPSRFSQLISDVLVIVIPGLIACIGLWTGKPWAKRLFAFALGAALYAFVFDVSYLRWDNYFGGPWIVSLLLLLAFTGFAAYAFWALHLKWGWFRNANEAQR